MASERNLVILRSTETKCKNTTLVHDDRKLNSRLHNGRGDVIIGVTMSV